MKEYIEREAVLIYAKMLVHTAYERKEKITDDEIEKLVYGIHADFTGAELGAIPAADVVEVRHGEWEEVEIEYAEDIDVHPDLTTMRCNKCNRYHTTIFFYGNPTAMMNYCPHCGAKMDGGVNDGKADS